jgi:hypothetical protein
VITIDRRKEKGDDSAHVTGLGLDVVFPVLHGPFGEDGTVQGLLELANVAYIGAGVLASAVGMDKAFMKLAFAARGCPSPTIASFAPRSGGRNRESLLERIQAMLGFPVFVKAGKPGLERRHLEGEDRADLATAIDLAFEFDLKVVVEAAVPAARELEVGVAGQRRGRDVRWLAKSSPVASSTTTKPSISTPGRWCTFPPIWTTPSIRKCVALPSRRSGRWMAPAWHGRFPAVARQRSPLCQRGQHHSRVHHDQHVLEALGGHGR